MPFQKGRVKTGGRKKGSPHRLPPKTVTPLVIAAEFQAALVREFTPLEVMHAIMLLRVSKADYDGALSAAEKAAPYVHPRLNAAEVRVQHMLAARSDEEVAAEIQALQQKLAIARGGLPLLEAEAQETVQSAIDITAQSPDAAHEKSMG